MSMAVRSTIKRHPERGSHETDVVHAVLDAAPMGHLGFVVDGQPFVIPMLYGRIDEAIYLHGSVASRLLRTMAGGVDVCLTATLVDGLVLARSQFQTHTRKLDYYLDLAGCEGDARQRAVQLSPGGPEEYVAESAWYLLRKPG